MWIPYFGEFITNHRGVREHTFPYVLRHTQMRPRQLIVLCNSIAAHGRNAGRFPVFSEIDIREGIRMAEGTLATEIINSYNAIYPEVGHIVDALTRIPKVFMGNELDRRAKESASAWRPGTYSPMNFRRPRSGTWYRRSGATSQLRSGIHRRGFRIFTSKQASCYSS